MIPGRNVVLSCNLMVKHAGIRFDPKTIAVHGPFIPMGTRGTVERIAGNETLIELYWNPSNIPGNGHVAYLWVLPGWFNMIFEYA
jgi:hypothetical protein